MHKKIKHIGSKSICKAVFFSVLFSFFAVTSFAQQAQVPFGKNRIQHKNFHWEYLSTENFDIYFYVGGRESAIYASKYAELDLPNIVNLVGYSSDHKIKLIVYNSPHDLLQSNIGFDEPNPAVGGQTNFIKSKVEVAFRGNHTEFRKEINEEVAKLLINEMFYGGNLREIIRNSYTMNIPSWFIEGAAGYVAGGWSQEMDDYCRNYFIKKKPKSPYLAQGKEAKLVGMSMWNYVVEQYGKANMANILNYTQYTKSEQKAISSVLGMDYNVFVKEWKGYYTKRIKDLPEVLRDPDKQLKVKKYNKKGRVYDKIGVSNTGEYIVYSQNVKGHYKVILHHLVTGKNRRLTSGGYKTVDQKPDYSLPLVSVGQDLIGVVTFKKKKIVLKTYKANGKFFKKVPLAGFENVLDFDFSDDGNAIVFSAQKDGQTDLHYYNFKDNLYRQLTNDFADDLQPQFLNGSRKVVFSSNRREDTLTSKMIIANKVKIKDYFDDYDLFIYPEITGSKKLLRLTEGRGNETHPVALNQDNILYLNDESGIIAINKINIDTKTNTQISAFVNDIKEFDVYPGVNTLAYVMSEKEHENLYVDPTFNFNADYKFDPTERISMISSRKVLKEDVKLLKEPLKKVVKKEESDDINPADLLNDENTEIDIENYVFESDQEALEQKNAKEKKTKAPEDLIKMVGPSIYKGILSLDNLISGVSINNLLSGVGGGGGIFKGVGINIDAKLSDMMGNHRFNGGLWMFSDLSSSNMYGEYWYLKRRIDFQLRYEKQALLVADQDIFQKYKLEKFVAGFSYPISNASKITLQPTFFATRFLQIANSGSLPDNYRYYGGYKLEYMFDNTVSMNMNMPQGTRIKMYFEAYNTAHPSDQMGFSRAAFDLRNYFKIHRELVFASRFSGGHSFGPAAKNFMLGGADNWISGQSNLDGPLAFSNTTNNVDVLMSQYATGLRGFQLNEMWGQTYLLMNLELRIPIIRYLVKGNISSPFFRNLQLVTFMDYGAAWTGTNIFNSENSFNTKYFTQGSFDFKVVNYNNPFLTSYGLGLRSYLLGYYLKCDVAWPIRNYKADEPMFVFSIGHDF